MSDVFISYSRQESLFANRIADELEKNGRTVWIDRKGIELTTDWWDEISRGIEGADNFVLVMSPSSLSSPVCHLEIELALQLTKRIIPLYHIDHSKDDAEAHFHDRLYKFDPDGYLLTQYGERDPMATFTANWEVLPSITRVDALRPVTHYEDKDGEQVPAKLDDDAFAKFLALLNRAIDTDMAHVRTHTRLLTHIRDWEKSERKTGFLLTPAETEEAEAWLQAWEDDKQDRATRNLAPKNPMPDDAIRNFIAISRKEVDTVKRQQRNLVIATVTFAVVGILSVLAVIGSLITLDDARTQTALAQADATTAGFAQATAQSDVAIAETQVENAINAEATATRVVATSVAIEATTTYNLEQAGVRLNVLAIYSDAFLNTDEDDRSLIERISDVVAFYPEEDFAHFLYGLALQGEDEYELALSAYDESIRLNPQDANSYGNRAIVYEILEDYDAAFEDYMTAIRLAPDDPLNYSNRANLKWVLEDYAGARDDYQTAIEISPTHPNVAQWWYLLSIAHYEEGDMDASFVAVNEVLEIDATNGDALAWRGLLKSDVGNHEAAILDFNEALALNPDDDFVLFERGYSHLELGNYEASQRDFEAVLQLDPENALAYSNLGLVKEAQGDLEGAIADLRQAVALDPELEADYADLIVELEADLEAQSE
jgi:tetratricopeptide (TPR) repeat protein